MKHLRIALEDEETTASKEVVGDLSDNVEALATIADDMPDDSDDLPSRVSMESFVRQHQGPKVSVALAKFRASMEDVSGGVIAAIAAGIVAAIALIVKAINYFFPSSGGSSGGGGGSGIAEVIEEKQQLKGKIHDKIDAVREVDNQLHHKPVNVKDKAGKTHRVTKLADVTEIIEDDKNDDLYLARLPEIHKSEFVRLIKIIDPRGGKSYFDDLHDRLKETNDKLAAVMDKHAGIHALTVETAKEVIQQLNAIQFDDTIVVDGKQISPDDLEHKLMEASVLDRPSNERIPYVDYLKRVQEYVNDPGLDNTLSEIKDADVILHAIKKMFEEAQGTISALHAGAAATKDDNSELAQLQRQVAYAVGRVVNFSVSTLRALIKLIRRIEQWTKAIIVDEKHQSSEAAKAMRLLMKAPEMPEDLRTGVEVAIDLLGISRK